MSNLITPPALQKGDKIALLSSARYYRADLLQERLHVIRNMGLDPVISPNVSNSWHQFAGTDEERAADLQWALDDPEIKAIICVRGGYGTIRIIDQLDFTLFKQNPKWIAGYSDVTVLHSHIHQTCQVETLHSTMLVNMLENTPEALDSLERVLFGNTLLYNVPSHPLNRKGEATGQVIGGNLSIIYALMGSSAQPNTDGKILFLEDLDEYLYHIDRMLQNLKRGGLLDNLAGMVIGGLTNMHDHELPFGFSAEEIIHQIVKNYAFPVAFDFPAGHIDDNRPLILGRTATLTINEKTTLNFHKHN